MRICYIARGTVLNALWGRRWEGDPKEVGIWICTLEKEMAAHSSILAWRIPWNGGAWRATVHGVSQTWSQLSTHTCACVADSLCCTVETNIL